MSFGPILAPTTPKAAPDFYLSNGTKFAWLRSKLMQSANENRPFLYLSSQAQLAKRLAIAWGYGSRPRCWVQVTPEAKLFCKILFFAQIHSDFDEIFF
jgi:hypothetical protein